MKAQLELLDEIKVLEKSVTQSNFLVRAGYNLSTTEMRLFLLAASKINPTKWKQNWFLTVSASEWRVAFGGSNKNNIYRDMKDASEKLLEQPPLSILSEEGNQIRVQWVSSCEYMPDKGEIEIEFSKKLREYLAYYMLGEYGYTTILIENIGRVSSPYAMRLYGMMMQFYSKDTKSGWLKITPEELIYILQLPTSYQKNKGSILQKILKPAIKSLNKTSNIKAELTVSKRIGRSVKQYLITFKSKEGEE